MKTDDFDYFLPPASIAQEPLAQRDEARLLEHDLGRNETRHRRVRDLTQVLKAGDLLVVNDTRVRPVRLFGRRQSGGKVEFLLTTAVADHGPRPGVSRWLARVHPARKLRPGERIELDGGAHALAVERPAQDDGKPGPHWMIDLVAAGGTQVEELLLEIGRMPLPPYIQREPGSSDAEDRKRYQTVFADKPGAIAAPTAGLHFTEELLQRLEAMGVERATVTLHVGEGTFQPVAVQDLDQHPMHSESYELPPQTVAAVEACRRRGGRVFAVGTTSVRVLESCVDAEGILRPGSGATRLFLRPGSEFKVVDALLTNFHLPRSTLLMLVSAFAGFERTMELYRIAVEQGYRFYSYGDAMCLHGREGEPH